MTPRERYDAAVEATRLLTAVFNDLPGAGGELRRSLYVAVHAAQRCAHKLHGPAFEPTEEQQGDAT